MRFHTRLAAKLRWHHMVHFGIFLSAVFVWPILGEYEVFELFYEFSRAHEEWEVDELALLFLNLTAALLFSTIYQTRHLKKMSHEREALRRSAEANARHDPLTGVLNRRAFSDVAEAAVAEVSMGGDPRYLALLDLDKFKPVNDVHGHAIGDATLCEVVRRLQKEIGKRGVVARLGGDEFAVLMDPLVDHVQAERCAQRIVHEIAQPFEINGTSIYIGTSVGLAALCADDDVSEVMRRADKALYLAKDDGRGRFAWYNEDLDQKSLDRAKIAGELREAIAKDQVEPWFQPIIDIEKNRVSGVEVLARWNHPDRGFVRPDVFIEIAEDSGQIGALGLSILRQALTKAKLWTQPLSVSVNVSGIQFKDTLLVSSIRNVLDQTGFPAERLVIEVTESSVIHDFSVAREKLEELKALGVAIALDDFGTGYSSLACLQNLPFDRLKIDRSFVTDISEQPQSQKIVTGIISLAQGLQLEVTAEGIETVEDLAFISYLDCKRAQGFLFEKAVPADQVSEFLETKWAHLPKAPDTMPRRA